MKNCFIFANILSCDGESAHSKQINDYLYGLSENYDRVIFISALTKKFNLNYFFKKINFYRGNDIYFLPIPPLSVFVRLSIVSLTILFIRILNIFYPFNIRVFTRSQIIAFIAVNLGFKVIYQIHYLQKDNYFLSNYILKSIVLKTKKIICISPNLKKDLLKRFREIDQVKSKLKFIPLVPISNFNLSNSPNKFVNQVNKIFVNWKSTSLKKCVYIGSLDKLLNDDFRNFFESFQDFNIMIVGGNKNKFIEIFNFLEIDSYLINERIFHIEFTKDNFLLDKIRNAADFFLISNPISLKYYFYTSPLKLFEYSKFNKPIIVIGDNNFLNGLKYIDFLYKITQVKFYQSLNKFIEAKKDIAKYESKLFQDYYSIVKIKKKLLKCIN